MRVQRLEPGTQITITLRDSRVVRFFLGSDNAGLTVLDRTDPLTRIFIPREDVVEIRKQPARHVGSHARRGALIGGLAGGLLIIVVAGSIEGSHDAAETWGVAGAGALVGGLTGTAIGAFIGISVPESADLVYRAPRGDKETHGAFLTGRRCPSRALFRSVALFALLRQLQPRDDDAV
jgi:hypothetical protein